MHDASTEPQDAGDAVAAAFPVSERKAWIAVVAIALIFAGVFAWLIFGQLPQEVRGDAVIVPSRGFIDVGRGEQGVLGELLVDPGDLVKSGQVVARLETEQGGIDVKAPVAGTIASILERVGGTSAPGQPILTMSSTEEDEVAVSFVPAGAGNNVKPGMRALVALATYPQAQYGTITGTVLEVSTLPVTTDRLDVLMGGNDALVRYFTAQGPMLEVTVQLDRNPASPNGYNWTIGTGPSDAIPVGSLGEVEVIIAEGSPLARFLR